MKILVVGGGYIGKRCAEAWGDEAILETKRIECQQDADYLLISKHRDIDVVLNAAGVKGKPNVDWCETHQQETALGNIQMPIWLANACKQRNLYLLHIGSGCVFYGKSPDPNGWKEDDGTNPVSYYSKTKFAADLALGSLPNVGIARIRIPLDDRPGAGNIVDKLATYKKIIDVENSITVIPDMIEVFYKLMEKKAEGIFHVTNPGTLKYKDLMAWYRHYVDPNQTNEWINEEELLSQGLVTKTRSTNILQSTRLEKLGISMPPVDESAKDAMTVYSADPVIRDALIKSRRWRLTKEQLEALEK